MRSSRALQLLDMSESYQNEPWKAAAVGTLGAGLSGVLMEQDFLVTKR
jgi:hypothetical protein